MDQRKKDYDSWLQKTAIDRLLRFAGKNRNEVRNPCFTARETIAIADEVVKWKETYEFNQNLMQSITKIEFGKPIDIVEKLKAETPDLDHSAPFGVIDPDYARVFTIARCIAWQEGYSACLQGSFTRDLDILLTPWTDSARPDIHVIVMRICQASGLENRNEPSNKPHGRKAWSLIFPKFGDPRFVDISIFQPKEKS